MAAAAGLHRSPSLISFSVTSDKKPPSSPSLVTAPCSRCGHAEPIRSLLSVVERTVVRCQTCSTADPRAPSGVDLDRGRSTVSEALHRSFADLESTLHRHGADLDRLSLLPRLAPSKLTEIVDGDDGDGPAGGNGQQQQLVLARRPNRDDSEHAAGAGVVVPHHHHRLQLQSHGASNSHNGNSHGRSNGTGNSSGCVCGVAGGLGAGSGGGLPVHDVDDLKQLTAGVTRLLKTLHDRISRLDAAERQLQSEREALRRDREEVNRLRQTLRAAGLDDGLRSRSPEGRDSPVRGGSFTPRDQMSKVFPPPPPGGRADEGVKSFDIADDGRTLPLSRAMSFATIDYSSPSRVEWTDEKEQQLAALEKLLVRANRNWSDKQEDVLPMVCPSLRYTPHVELTAARKPGRTTTRRAPQSQEAGPQSPRVHCKG